MTTTTYAVHLSNLNRLQQNAHPLYWLFAPLLTQNARQVGSAFDDWFHLH